MTGHGITGIADAGAFLARLVRLDPAAVVRLRSADGRTALWGRLPWQVLVTRTVAGDGPGDVTVAAADLLAAFSCGSGVLPAHRDDQWRWPLPSGSVEVVETVGAGELTGLVSAAAGILREAAEAGVHGRAVGQRALRDALLDHVALTVTRESADPVEVPQRLVQAVARMGFVGPADGPGVRVCVTGRWIGLAAHHGVGWMHRATTLTLMPLRPHPNG